MHSTDGGAASLGIHEAGGHCLWAPFFNCNWTCCLMGEALSLKPLASSTFSGGSNPPRSALDGSLLKATWRSLLGRCSGRGITKIKRSIRRESPCQSINFLPLCFCTSSLFFYVTAFPTGERVVEIPEVQRLYWRTRLFGFPNQVYRRESRWRNSQKAAMIN